MTEKYADFSTELLEGHSGEITILIMFSILVISLFVLIPQLLRAHLRKAEMFHAATMKALERGLPLPPVDESARAAGRTTMLVPVVVVICACTVTCFLVVYRSEFIFSVALAVWSVAGVVSLAAITGGVALIGRLAQLKAGDEEDYPPDNPLEG